MAYHFTVAERVILYGLLETKTPKTEIVKIIQFDRSSISCKIKRNSGKRFGFRGQPRSRPSMRNCFFEKHNVGRLNESELFFSHGQLFL
jgi:hypothetical protein